MYYGLSQWQFWFFGWHFFISFCLAVLLPGLVLLKKTRLGALTRLTAAIGLGLSLFALQGFAFGYFGVRSLSYLYVAVFVVCGLRNWQVLFSQFREIFQGLLNVPRVTWLLIFLGSLIQWSVIWPSGLLGKYGIDFVQINGHDGLFHLAVIDSIAREFPPHQPGANELLLTNYHYWADLTMGEMVRLFNLPTIHLYFHYFPLILGPLLGLSTYSLLTVMSKKKAVGNWGVFFHYFSGDLVYLFMLLLHGTYSMSSVSIDNGAIQFINMPQAFAKFVFFSGLMLLGEYLRSRKALLGFFAAFLMATLVGFKIYFGIFAALGWLSLTVFMGIRDWHHERSIQRGKELFGFGVVFALIAGLIFWPTNKGAGGLFWAPLAWPKLLIGVEKLNWNDWWLRLQVYEAAGNSRNIIILHVIALVIFMVAIFGTRLLGFLPTRRIRVLAGPLFWFLYPAITVCTFLGLNTLQVSGGYNVFNFFVVSLTGLSLLTPFVFASIRLPRLVQITMSAFLSMIMLPRIVDTAYSFIQSVVTRMDLSTITHEELQALNVLRQAPKGVLAVDTHNELDKQTPYIPFFTNKQGYVSGRFILKSHNQPIDQRALEIAHMIQGEPGFVVAEWMALRNIDYLWLTKLPGMVWHHYLLMDGNYFSLTYENDTTILLKRIPFQGLELYPRIYPSQCR